MYCTHCGEEIDENKIESKKVSLACSEGKIDESTQIEYICPRCGHLIHHGVTAQETKTLAAASHAEIQRGRNFFASGMSLNCVGTIILILAIIFLVLSNKPTVDYIVVTCPEFYVSMVCFVIGFVMLVMGIVFTIRGIVKKSKYEKLLERIQDETFFQ